MNTTILTSELSASAIARAYEHAPVKNLTDEEIRQTWRLLQLKAYLVDVNRPEHQSVSIWQNDKRLEGFSDDDRFLALLLDADVRNILLMSKRCCYCFGKSPYLWQKVARRCPLTTTKAGMMDGDHGGQYYGKGWVIAPHIKKLAKWMIENIEHETISKLTI